MKKYFIVILLGGGIVSAVLIWQNHQASQNEKIDAMTFTNTMEWDPSLLTSARQKTRYSQNWEDYIHLDPPPTNTSKETKQELEDLVADKSLRTEEKIKEINSEINFTGAEMGDRNISEYFDSSKYPLTALVLGDSYYHISIITLAAKEKFNRVRPSFLEPEIEPIIEIPGHPAYPNGHSTQSHFVALVLGELMPSRKEEFWSDADRIMRNREIAGVHYPSDGQAGVKLAQQFFDHLKQDHQFQIQLSAARSEWK